MNTNIFNSLLSLNSISALIQENLENSYALIQKAQTAYMLFQNQNSKELNESTNEEKENCESSKRKKYKIFKKGFSFCCKVQNCLKKYTTKENLNLHVSNFHLNLKPYKCSYCTKVFSHRNGIFYF